MPQAPPGQSDLLQRAAQVTSLTAEQQAYGESLIRMSEHATTRPLTAYQLDVLAAQGSNLPFLGLSVLPQLDGTLCLQASHIVGCARFVHQKKEMIVQIEPKVRHAAFLRMIDHTIGYVRRSDNLTHLSLSETSPVGLFLGFFADRALAFLQQASYRNYSFSTAHTPGRVKGRLLLEDYLACHLPRLEPHVLPCRYLEFSSDVLENQVIAYTVHLAIQLASVLPSASKASLLKRLGACSRLLRGVAIRRVTLREIAGIRYTRINARFEPIHLLCQAILRGQSVSLRPGDRLPFVSFAVAMPQLFEAYVAAILSSAFGSDFIGHKSLLTFPLGVGHKFIVLDGLVDRHGERVVIECKYKAIGPATVSEADDVEEDGYYLLTDRINGRDIYQVVAYASHQAVEGTAAVLVHPTWEERYAPIVVSDPILALGWYTGRRRGLPVYAIGINLSSSFDTLVDGLGRQIQRIIHEVGQ